MGEKVSEAPEPVPRGRSSHGAPTPAPAVAAESSPGASSAESSSGSETLSEEGESGFSREQPPPPPPGGARPAAAWAPALSVPERGVSAPPPRPGGAAPPAPRGSSASQEEQDEELDHILSPPPMPFRKCSNPDVAPGPGKSLKFKRQLSEDGRQLRRGSLGGALTGRYLLPNPAAGQAWGTSAETSNLVRMRSQALGQSAPSLTASLEGQPPKSHFNSARHRQRLVDPAASKKELSLPRRGSLSLGCALDQKGVLVILFDISHPAQTIPEGIQFIPGDIRCLSDAENDFQGVDVACVFHIMSYKLTVQQ
ncbi:hypothetical protein AB1E18_015140 [Capra hircus]